MLTVLHSLSKNRVTGGGGGGAAFNEEQQDYAKSIFCLDNDED